MTQILRIAMRFFEEYDWPYFQRDDEPVLRTAFRGDNGEWSCYAFADEDQQQFAFYSVCSVRTPEDRRLALAEFITRLNHGLVIGNFELDFSDGEIRFKTSIDVEGDRLSTTLVRRMVVANVATMDMHLPGIAKAIYGDVPPAQGLAAMQGGVEDNQRN